MNDKLDLVFKNEEGRPATSSLLVAQKFGKRHANVLQAIRNLEKEITEVPEKECKLNFVFTSRLIEQPNGGWRSEEFCIMDRDGFSLLIMGFTGKEALRFKLAFIAAFNRMEETLRGMMGDREEIRQYVHTCIRQYMECNVPLRAAPPLTIDQELDVRADVEAHRFFDGYHPDRERPWVYLDKQAAAEYYANACVLNAVANLMKKLYGVRGRSKKYNSAAFWSQVAKLLLRVDVESFPHTLPLHPRRLQAKYMKYIKRGYESLIHQGMNNQNARKRNLIGKIYLSG